MADKLDLPQVRGFKMVSLNIASLPLHIDEFRTWLDNKNIDVIALNETRLDNTLSTNQLKINNYELVRKDRNRYGGGVCIYIKSHINYRVRHDLINPDIEAIIIEIIKPNSKPFAIVASYRPPEFSPELFFDQMTTIIKQLEHESKDIFIFGDLNCDLLSDRSHRATFSLSLSLSLSL